ncbi:MAG: hypothetical protein AAF242_20175 [Bacteroidota bacterium]
MKHPDNEKKIKGFIGFQLIILLAYGGFPTLLNAVSGELFLDVWMYGMAIFFHFGILLLGSLFYFAVEEIKLGQKYLLAGIVVLVVGFSTCMGVMAITT